ncbi:hypothetical protein CR970_03445 [Candidatus Saccharibacteria bacterium]|nr:MAG: hypothetical protein CR970_03445 [Candidatus Saccharibacteria bacterium]
MHSDSNDKTLASYNSEYKTYIQNTPQTFVDHYTGMKRWMDALIAALPENGKILEIGSATLRDATYFRSQGCRIQCSDGCKSFVDDLKDKGEPAILLNALTDPIPEGYAAIYLNGVFPHFNADEAKLFLEKCRKSLPGKGLLAFSAKMGEGQNWIVEKISSPRFAHYWDYDELENLLATIGFEVDFKEDGLPADVPDVRWMTIIARKK